MQVIIKYTKHPQKWPNKNSTKQPPKIFDHLLENPIRTFFQNIPKNGQPRIPQNNFPRFSTIFCIFSAKIQTTA